MKLQTNLIMLALAVITLPFLSCDNDNVSDTTTKDIQTFIETKYPGAQVVKIEREDNKIIEADIIHDNLNKDVVFDLSSKWLYTSWDVRISELPQAVSAILNDPDYAGYHIDDADFVETPNGNYYLLELEKGNSESKVKVDETGKILN